MYVNEFMTKNVVSCNDEQTLTEAVKLMTEKMLSVLPIVDSKEHLIGIITEPDFVGKEVEVPHALATLKELFGQKYYFCDVEKIYHSSKNKKLCELMSKNPVTITSSTLLTETVDLMLRKGFKRLPVVDNGKLVGIVTRKDLLKAFSLV